MPRREPCSPPALPSILASAVDGLIWHRDLVGESGCTVFCLMDSSGQAARYLKHAPAQHAGDLIDEHVRLQWLHTRTAVPGIGGFVSLPGEAWLLTDAVGGFTAHELLTTATMSERGAVVDAMADHLRRLHAIPPSDCPFNAGAELRVALAKRRMELGLVDQDDFDEERQGETPEALWERLMSLAPSGTDPVVTHGDYSLDNLLFPTGQPVACIDVGRVGLADRYQDIAIAWNSLGEFGRDLQQRFVRRYGIVDIDEQRLEFHLILDEFF